MRGQVVPADARQHIINDPRDFVVREACCEKCCGGTRTVCLPWTNIFYFFHFYVLTVVLLKGMGESFLLSKDEPLTPNID